MSRVIGTRLLMLTPCVALVVDDEEAAAAWAAVLKRAMVLASVKMGPDEDEPMAAVVEKLKEGADGADEPMGAVETELGMAADAPMAAMAALETAAWVSLMASRSEKKNSERELKT